VTSLIFFLIIHTQVAHPAYGGALTVHVTRKVLDIYARTEGKWNETNHSSFSLHLEPHSIHLVNEMREAP